MERLIEEIKLLKGSSIKQVIDSRMREFEALGKKESVEIFKELCFCLLTANYSAEGGIKIQREIGSGFLFFDRYLLAEKLKFLGHRFPNARAGFIVNTQNLAHTIKGKIESIESDHMRREWLVKNVKGIGMKEASHFLRNIGYGNVAIIDFHIVDLLVRNNLIEKPKAINQKKYLEIEGVLKKLSGAVGINLGELDLYLWYMETGKVLK